MTGVEIAGNPWFRALAPVVVLILFELLIRYLGKSDRQRLRLDDYFLALPLLGSAITALPGLMALRAERHPSEAEISGAAFILIVLTVTACWLVVFDRRTLRKHRRDNPRLKQALLCVVLPDVLAAIALGMVFAYAP